MRDCETCKHYIVVENRHDRETTKSCECWECNYERGMTESEAIEILRFAYPKEINRPITKEVIGMAIKALEKQIPKKLIKWADGTEHCPACDCDNSCIGYGVCIDCGQKLDWESEEE